MNHVHDSQETTPLEAAWQNFLREAGMATAVTASKYFDEALKARIADELPNIAKAVMNTPLDKLGEPIECETFAAALPPQPEAAGDVPEWLTDYEGKSIDGFDTQAIWDAVNAEISRRVADVAADRDKWIERAGEHAKTIGEQAKRIAFLDEQCSRNQQAYYAMTEERDSLRQQLAAAQAEVERLKDQLDCKQAFWDAEIEISKTVTKERDEYFAEIVKLRSEVSRLSRPVEGDWWAVVSGRSVFAICKWQDRAEEYQASHCPSGAVERINFNPDTVCSLRKDLQAERNARESAERERDELREAVNMNWNVIQCENGYRVNTKAVSFSGLFPTKADAVLAAHRAEKGRA